MPDNDSGSDIQRRVISVLADYTSARVAVPKPESDIVLDLGIDSLELLAAITSLEQEFNVRVPDDIMSEISTVGELSNFIEARLSVKTAADTVAKADA